MDIAIAFLGGLGLFLTGLRILSTSTRQMSGPWLRRAVAAGTRGPLTSALTGLVVGGVTQSTSAVTLVASGLVQTGLLEVRRALPLLSWTNVGTCGVVLMASLDTQSMALVMVGLAGLLAYFRLDLKGRIAPALGALVGLGTLFLGLGIIKAGVAPLRDLPLMQALMTGANGLLPPFLVGGAIAFLSQTSSTATLIALAFTAAGLMSFDQTVMAIYGAAIGSGLGMLLAAGDLRGTPRRLAHNQVVWRTLGTLVFIGLYAVERAGVPLLLAASDAIAGGDLAFRVGVLVVLFQAGTALLLWPLDRHVLRLLAAWSPETPVEALARPAFIHAGAAEDGPTALALAAREQARLAARLPALLDAARAEAASGPGRTALDEGCAALEAALDAFLAETLTRAEPDPATLEALVALRARGQDLAALRAAASGLAALAEPAVAAEAPHAAPLRRMAEALHLLLEEFAEALAAPDPAEPAATLAALTADRSETLDALRRGLATREAGLGAAGQEAVLRAMALFERAAWLIRRQSLALLPAPAPRRLA